jgi:glutaredoxin
MTVALTLGWRDPGRVKVNLHREGYMKYLYLLIVLLPITLGAEVYKWTDKDGKVHFSDKPPADQQAETLDPEELKKRANSYAYVSVEIAPIDFTVNRQSNQIVMYATAWCKYCEKARRHFQQNNIDYVEKDIDNSSQARKEYDDFGGTGVPVIFLGKYRMNGFSIKRFSQYYEQVFGL